MARSIHPDCGKLVGWVKPTGVKPFSTLCAYPKNAELNSHPGHTASIREFGAPMKTKTRHRKSYKWRKECDSSPVAKGRRPKIHGVRNPSKAKRAGGVNS
jgi:hypothetical protein